MSGHTNGALSHLRSIIAMHTHDDVAQLAHELHEAFTLDDLIRIAAGADVESQKAALYAVTLLGDTTCTLRLTPLLRTVDPDVHRAVETALWSLWFKSGRDDVDRLMEQGVRSMRQQQWQEALRLFNNVVALSPTYPEGYNQRAVIFYLAQQWDHCIADCETALRLNPAHFGAMAGMGHCYLHKNELEPALQAYESALSVNPALHEIRRAADQIRRQLEQDGG